MEFQPVLGIKYEAGNQGEHQNLMFLDYFVWFSYDLSELFWCIMLMKTESVQYKCEESGGHGAGTNRMCSSLLVEVQQWKWRVRGGDKWYDPGVQFWDEIHGWDASARASGFQYHLLWYVWRFHGYNSELSALWSDYFNFFTKWKIFQFIYLICCVSLFQVSILLVRLAAD